MSDAILRPRNLKTASIIDASREIVTVLTTATDGDRIADAMETAAGDAELAHAVMMELLCKVRGWDDPRTGVERVAAALEPETDLWTP